MVASVTRLKAAATTVHYFEVDGYYARNDPEHRRASRWHGEAAALLGLHGRVDPKRFEAVLAGYVPGTDLRLGRLRDGEHQHRPGVDVTFSAPKSVSLEALVYAAPKTGTRVVRAHDEAVRATLGFIETELLQTRSYERETGRRPRVQADGMAAATFRHLASRNLDPQLHTHAVIANMTRGRDGDWRSAEFTSVERSKLLIGAYYRHELRTRLEEIGYATIPTLVGRMPGFEIAGYRRPMLDAFSTRRRELLDYMRERGWENTPARTQQAALYTRQRKAEPDRRVLHETWRERAREIGPARDRDMARGRNGLSASASSQREPRDLPSALSVVRRAVEHLEERRTVFSANDLRAWALAHGGGRHSLEALDAGIAQLRRDGHLIEAKARRADLAFVTDRARAAERDIISGMRVGLDAGGSLAPEAAIEARLDAAGLNEGQRDAARAILLSPHRTVGVQGHAGSGKTTMLRAVRELAGERRIVGLAPSASAVHVLAGEADLPARTLQGFLARYRDVGDGIALPERTEEARQTLGGAVLILDEASMVGTMQMRALTRIAENTGVARLALIGDRRQLRAVEAGQPFGLLQDAGMPTARMDEVVRQRDADLKAAVLHMVADEPRMAVEELGNGVLETDSDELGRKAAQLWLDLDPSLRSRNGDPGPDARAEGRDQRRRPPGPGGRGRAARPRAGDRALRQPAPDALAEGRGRELPAGRRGGVPPRRLRRQGQGRRCLPRAGGAGRWAGAAGPSRRPGSADRPGRLHPLPARPLRDNPDGPQDRRPSALDPQRPRARPSQRRACGAAVHRPGEPAHADPGRPRDRHAARRPAAPPPGPRLVLDRARGPGHDLRPGDRGAGHGPRAGRPGDVLRGAHPRARQRGAADGRPRGPDRGAGDGARGGAVGAQGDRRAVRASARNHFTALPAREGRGPGRRGERAAQGGGALRRPDPVGGGGRAPGAGRARPRSSFA